MPKLKIATFNINSVRIRQQDLLDWMDKDDIDIVALQETKVQDKDFPLEGFSQAGYHAIYKGEKGRNGVAIISRQQPQNSKTGLDNIGADEEARLIQASFGDLTLINTYVPQGREVQTPYFQYKLDWLRGVRQYLEANFHPEQKVIWLGDLNVAPEPIDVYDAKRLYGQVGYHPDEHAAFNYTKSWGLHDLFRKHVPDAGHYTFWDYRVKDALERGIGWRIDHVLATAAIADNSSAAYVATELRQKERPSDHAPLVVELNI